MGREFSQETLPVRIFVLLCPHVLQFLLIFLGPPVGPDQLFVSVLVYLRANLTGNFFPVGGVAVILSLLDQILYLVNLRLGQLH